MKFEDGKCKIMRDGYPFYCAAWVKDLTPCARDMMFRGSDYKGPSRKQLELWMAMRHPQTTYIESDKKAA